MKLVEDSKDWSKWWSIRLSIIGGAILTFLEAFPNAVATVIQTLPDSVTNQVGDEILRVIAIVCIVASPIARVIKQSKLDNKND
jgi:preprotein translocase subunit SecY